MMSTGSGSRDNSVQFSLSELMKLEVERVEEEDRAKKAREADLARIEAEARAAEERARLAAEATKREKERLEEAKREALKSAAVEQARIEVESHARAMERERERRHELELATQRALVKSSANAPAVGMLFGATMFGGLLMLVVVLAVHLGVSKPVTDRQVADLEGRIALAEKKADEANHRADDLRNKATTAESERNDARAEVERLKAALANKPGKKDAVPAPTPVPATPKPVVKDQPACDPHDPMCFALPKAG